MVKKQESLSEKEKIIINKFDKFKYVFSAADLQGISILGMCFYHAFFLKLLDGNVDVALQLLDKYKLLYLITPIIIFASWGNFFGSLSGLQCVLSLMSRKDSAKACWKYIMQRLIFAVLIDYFYQIFRTLISTNFVSKNEYILPTKLFSIDDTSTFVGIGFTSFFATLITYIAYLLGVKTHKTCVRYDIFIYITITVLMVILIIYSVFYFDLCMKLRPYGEINLENELIKYKFYFIRALVKKMSFGQFCFMVNIYYSFHASMLGLLYTLHGPNQYKKLYRDGGILAAILVVLGIIQMFTIDAKLEPNIINIITNSNPFYGGYILFSLGLQTITLIGYGSHVDDRSTPKKIRHSLGCIRRSRIFRICSLYSFSIYIVDRAHGIDEWILNFFNIAYNWEPCISDGKINWNGYAIIFYGIVYTAIIILLCYVILYWTNNTFCFETALSCITTIFGIKFRKSSAIDRIKKPEKELEEKCKELDINIEHRCCCDCACCTSCTKSAIKARRMRKGKIAFETDTTNESSEQENSKLEEKKSESLIIEINNNNNNNNQIEKEKLKIENIDNNETLV